MNFLISSFIGYALGSIPTAYLIIKKSKGLDITKTGSGNVGAMNSYEVTNSKFIGLYVLAIDLLKGLFSVLAVYYFIKPEFIYCAVALIFAIFSHCYNPWIQFKGGRGLATAAGGMLFLFFPLLIAWVFYWFITYIFKKDILLSNILATLFSMISILFINSYMANLANPVAHQVNELILFSLAGLIIIFIKHMEPLRDILFQNKR